MRITEQADGYGASGCVTSTFDVKVYPASLVDATLACAAVVLKTDDDSITMPTFYVSTRTINDDGTASFHCVDAMARLGAMFDDSTITYTDDDITTVNAVLSQIRYQCGFIGTISLYGEALTPYVNKSELHNQTCRSVLEGLSAAWLGYWRINNDGLIFVRPEEYAGATATCTEYSHIVHKSYKEYSGLIMSDGNDNYSGGSTSSNALSISSGYASESVCNVLWGRLSGFKYQMWDCPMCKVSDYTPVGSGFVFVGDPYVDITNYYICNRITMYPTAAGLFAECGRNVISEDEWAYLSYTDRKLNNKQTKGEKVTVFVNYNATT